MQLKPIPLYTFCIFLLSSPGGFWGTYKLRDPLVALPVMIGATPGALLPAPITALAFPVCMFVGGTHSWWVWCKVWCVWWCFLGGRLIGIPYSKKYSNPGDHDCMHPGRAVIHGPQRKKPHHHGKGSPHRGCFLMTIIFPNPNDEHMSNKVGLERHQPDKSR